MSGVLNTVFNNVSFALQLHSRTITQLQEQASTGSLINRPSDDPATAYRVMGLDSHKRYIDNYINATDKVMNAQNTAGSVLQNMSESLLDMIVHLQQIVSGTYSDGQGGQLARERVAQEVNDILEQMVSSANTKYIDQYLFGGDNSTIMPYAVEKINGEIVSVTYEGSDESRNMEVATGINSIISFSGNSIFRSGKREEPEFFGSSGAVAGSGTSNIRNEVWLTVTHDGSNHRLSIDDGATNVVVPTSGDVSNIAVTNAAGDVLYVDATNITATGLDKVRFPGTEDVFNTLIHLRELLRDDREIPGEMMSDLIDEATEALEQVRNRLVEKEAAIGMRINFLDKLKNNLEDIRFNEEEEATLLQEADIAQIAVELAQRETLYQMSLSIAGKLMSNSLLDYLR